MKRERVLEETLNEVVNEIKAKDANGQPVYPFMQDPFVMALFGAPEALFEVLRDRPIVILNLLQTNKAFAAFWDQFENLWTSLIDSLVERAWPMPGSGDVYPFFAITNRRIEETTSVLFRDPTREKPTSFLRANARAKLLLPSTSVGQRQEFPDERYFLIYYDPLTKTLIEIYQRIIALSDFFKQPGDIIAERSRLSIFLGEVSFGMDHLVDAYLTSLGFSEAIKHHIVCLPDAFLISHYLSRVVINSGGLKCNYLYLRNMHEYLTERYAGYEHGPLLTKEVAISRQTVFGTVKVGIFPQKVAESLSQVIKLLSRLDYMLRHVDEEKCDPLMPVPIDSKLALPYRDLLYHPKQGLYNTPEKQKAFFIAILNTLANLSSKEEVIEQFGEQALTASFSCTICGKETQVVDPSLELAFCDIQCRSLYQS